MMGTVIYGAACSLDGYIARRDGGVDWLHFSSDVSSIMNETFARYRIFLWGRKTYQGAADVGASAVANTKNYVFSRTLESVGNGFELVSGDASAFVRSMKQTDDSDICVMGGGELGRSLFEGGLIDVVGLNVHPILLGDGIPLFPPMGVEVKLSLRECRPIHGGCVYATYDVTH